MNLSLKKEKNTYSNYGVNYFHNDDIYSFAKCLIKETLVTNNNNNNNNNNSSSSNL